MLKCVNFPTTFKSSEHNIDFDHSLNIIEDTQDCNVQIVFTNVCVYGKKLLIINIIEQLQHVNIH